MSGAGAPSRAADVAARNLRVAHTTAVVVGALQDRGIDVILLKGPSTVRWLYADEPRPYQDCDLLVSPGMFQTAERVLRDLGYTPYIEQEQMPAWWREHSVEWAHPTLALVDLHRTLKGVGVDDQTVWGVLSAERETMVVGERPCPVLSAPARGLVLALNRAGDGVDNGDVARAVTAMDRPGWLRAADLARRLDATPAFATGLRLVAPGRALADDLRLPRSSSVDMTIRTTSARRTALTVDRIARASGTRERAAIIRAKLVPPPTYMRHWWPQARRGRSGLPLAYVRRLGWVIREAPAAIRAWRQARDAAQDGSSGED